MDDIIKAIFAALYDTPWIFAVKAIKCVDGRIIRFGIDEDHEMFGITIRDDSDIIRLDTAKRVMHYNISIHDEDFMDRILHICDGCIVP